MAQIVRVSIIRRVIRRQTGLSLADWSASNTVIVPVDKSAWDNLSPEAVVATVAPIKLETTRWTMSTTLTNGLPATHLFKTSEGGIGILQIIDFTDNPPGVMVRYKLVQNGMTNALADQKPISPGPQRPARFGLSAPGLPAQHQ